MGGRLNAGYGLLTSLTLDDLIEAIELTAELHQDPEGDLWDLLT